MVRTLTTLFRTGTPTLFADSVADPDPDPDPYVDQDTDGACDPDSDPDRSSYQTFVFGSALFSAVFGMTDLSDRVGGTGLAFWDLHRALVHMAPTEDAHPQVRHRTTGHTLAGERQWTGEYSVRWARWDGVTAAPGVERRRLALAVHSAITQLEPLKNNGDLLPTHVGEEHHAFDIDLEVRQLEPHVQVWGAAYRVPLSNPDTDLRFAGFQVRGCWPTRNPSSPGPN